MGVCVGVSVGADVGGDVSVGMGVKVSVGGMLVDVDTGLGEGKAGVSSRVCPQAERTNINTRRQDRVVFFISSIVPKTMLNSSPRPEGGRSGRTIYSLAHRSIFCNLKNLKFFRCYEVDMIFSPALNPNKDAMPCMVKLPPKRIM